MKIPRNQLDKAAALGYQEGFSEQTLEKAHAKHQNRIIELTLEYAMKPEISFVRKEKTVQAAFENGFHEGQLAQTNHLQYINQQLQYLQLRENQREELNISIIEGRQQVFGHLYCFSDKHPFDLFFRQSDTAILGEEQLKLFDFETALEKSSLQRVLDILLKYSYQKRLGQIYLNTLNSKIEFYQLRNKRYHKRLDSKIYQSDKQLIVQKIQPFWSRTLLM